MVADHIMFIDLETQNNPYYGAIASPRHPENYVVMQGWCVEKTPYSGAIEMAHYKSKAEVPAKWLHIPDNVWLVVAHNAAYEMDWFLFCQRPEIHAFLKRGGRIFCTAYAEYLLSHQLNTYPSLEETAPQYGGSRKVDGIKLLWEQGIRTADIDPALLAEYLAGPEGDVANTRITFWGQYAKLVEQGMLGMALERMEGLVFNTFAMDAGLKIDPDVAFAQRAEGAGILEALSLRFQQYRSHIPEYVKFNQGSDFHMSAWLFGGPIKYKGQVYWDNDDGTPKWEKADFVKSVDGELIQLTDDGKVAYVPGEPPVSPEVFDFDGHIALERYKSGKNKGQIKVFREDTVVRKTKAAEMQFLVAPLVDLALLPQNIYKEFKKEFAGKRLLADNSPVFSTGKDCLDMLALRQEFPPHVRQVLTALKEWARIDKDMGTYYLREERNDEGVVVKQAGMLQFMTPEHYVHHTLNTTSTITTRLSSNKPNFQNLPRGETSAVKNMLVSRFGADGFIMEADYSALEVVTLAAFSKDKNLVKALLDGIDMHCMRLAAQLGEPYDDVKKKCKDENHPDYARYSSMRTGIKPKAFSYQYGATAHGIAFSTGCTVEEAQAFIDNEKELFPEVEAYFDNVIFPAVGSTTTMHREQVGEASWRLYGRGHWKAPGGTCYSFRQYEKKEWAGGQSTITMQYKPTQMRNYPIQGESGFFVQGMTGQVMRWLVQNDFFPDAQGNPRVYIINTVHDAIYLDVHKDVLDIIGGGVKAIMESLPQYFNANHGYDLQVPFPAAVEFGRSMGEKIHWHPGVLDEPLVRERLGWQLKEAA